jgi:hypothetical protein
MATPTYTPLANVTLGSAVSVIGFNLIPGTYRDLILIVSAPGSTTLEGRLRFNGDTGNNYGYVRMSGSGSGVTSVTAASQTAAFLSAIAQATTTGALQMNLNIMDYSATDKHKTIISRASQAANGTEAFANRWASTSAVTSIQIVTSTGNWAIGSTFALYGVIA